MMFLMIASLNGLSLEKEKGNLVGDESENKVNRERGKTLKGCQLRYTRPMS